MKKLLIVCLSLTIAACAAAGVNVLQSKSYKFVKFNEWVVAPMHTSTERMPTIKFDANMRITGVICNAFNGQTSLVDGILKGQMASTMMFCPDPEINRAESAFYAALNQGATVKESGKTLTITHGTNTFIFERITD